MFPDRLDEISASARNSLRLAEEIDRTGALNLASDGAVHLGRYSSHLPRKDASGIGGELGKDLRIFKTDLLKGKVETLRRHRLIVLPEVDPALDGLRLRHNLI